MLVRLTFTAISLQLPPSDPSFIMFSKNIRKMTIWGGNIRKEAKGLRGNTFALYSFFPLFSSSSFSLVYTVVVIIFVWWGKEDFREYPKKF